MIRKVEDNCINIENLDQKIYRVFSYDRFEQLINDQELVLVKPSMWEDPFENFFFKAAVDCGNNEVATLDNLAKDWYGQCWTTEKDTDAMWRIYSHDKQGVRVSTTIRKLFEPIFNSREDYRGLCYFIGKVNYWSESDIFGFLSNITFTSLAMGGQNDNFAELLCIKRPEFSHEHEVRLLANDFDETRGSNGLYRIPFDTDLLLDEICIDPRLSSVDANDLMTKIKALGVKTQIIQSPLYKIKNMPRIKLE
ncbi:DUF2971 domain-containing protein [Vibrio parahaemolyticus]